jgi:colanic acid/amylovoran biosynthesis glycosyltransferase
MPRPLKIAYIVMKYPTLSQTFIEREMLGLVAQGLEVEVHPCWDFRRPASIKETAAPALTLVRAGKLWPLLKQAAREAWHIAKERPALLAAAWRAFYQNLPRHAEGWFMTIWGTVFALGRAEEFRRRDFDVIHGAWATAPATVAAVLSALCGKPFSFGAHAYDLHRHGGDPLLAPKLAAARFVHTTTQFNVDHLRARFPHRRAEIVLARRGLAKLPPRESLPTPRDIPEARAKDRAVHLLSVGRLVEKKGHGFQIEACCELLRRGREFRLMIVGDGPLSSALETQADIARLGKRVEMAGALPPEKVEAAYAWADVFWHTGIVDSEGDRDGLPNVIPEAFAHGLPVISSAAGGAGEAVMDEQTGLIVDPADTTRLADAVERLADDAALRARLGAAGRAWAEEHFLIENNARRLAGAFASAAAAVGEGERDGFTR